MNVPPSFQDPEAKRVIAALCDDNSIDTTLLKDLCEVVHNYSGSGRADGVIADVTDCIDRFIARQEK